MPTDVSKFAFPRCEEEYRALLESTPEGRRLVAYMDLLPGMPYTMTVLTLTKSTIVLGLQKQMAGLQEALCFFAITV